ncbi:MAG TPA: hypothetical protein VEW95_05625 [Candidatus Limnocylindrales bacterium]|nr:hypothetical protein [Candidatus Limnocylindrales bacterium]
MTSEAIYNVVQFGAQPAHGTPVDATYLMPVDAGSVAELDRATTSPTEDYGDGERHHTSRGYHGVRAAGSSITAEVRFQDFMHFLEMHASGGVIPSVVGDHFGWEYLWDSGEDTLTRYTVEMGTDATQDQWQLSDCLIDQLDIGYDALTVPGASPWKATATFLAKDRLANALTAGLEPPDNLDTWLGHFTTLHAGPVTEAFADLDELPAHLASFHMRSSLGLARRKYGAPAGDTFDLYGRSAQGEVTFDAMVRISSASKPLIEDVFNVAGSDVVEQRWRLPTAGTGDNASLIDARVRFNANPIGDRDGEHVYAVTGYFVKDPTLASRARLFIENNVESLPTGGSGS